MFLVGLRVLQDYSRVHLTLGRVMGLWDIWTSTLGFWFVGCWVLFAAVDMEFSFHGFTCFWFD